MSTNSLQEMILKTLQNGDSIYLDPWGEKHFQVSVRKVVKGKLEMHALKCDYKNKEASKNLVTHLIEQVSLLFK